MFPDPSVMVQTTVVVPKLNTAPDKEDVLLKLLVTDAIEQLSLVAVGLNSVPDTV